MSHFNQAFLTFLRELEKNNSTIWFNENRKIYERDVKKPFSEFVEVMIQSIRAHEPDVNIRPSDAIMRINRDIRFSPDKTPYKTHVAANISKFGKKDKTYPGFYFQLSHTGVMIYGGSYVVDNTTLKEIRHYISDNLKGFSQAYNNNSFREKYGKILGEQNKRLPDEFRHVLQEEPLIANKQFYFGAELNPDIITSDELVETLMEYYKAGKSVNDFLKLAIG